MVKVIGIIAHDRSAGVGIDNKLPWEHIPEDMNHFKKTTINATIVMGRNTWDSLGNKKLPKRKNVVIANFRNSDEFKEKKLDLADEAYSGDVEEIVKNIKNNSETDVFVIGGPNIIKQSVNLIDEMIISVIDGNYTSDVFFDESILENFKLIDVTTIRTTKPFVFVKRYKREA